MGKPTKAIEIYQALAADIARGLLRPGAALDEVRIASQFGVSRTPIREAIRQLEMSGLVEARPHRGARVIAISEQQLDEMFGVMAELEGLCARWASYAMTTAERKSLMARHEGAAALVRTGDREGYTAANDRFHLAIYAGAHNKYLAELTRSIRSRVMPFRHAQFAEIGRLAKSHAEHAHVLDAILRRDGEGACAAMRSHISVVRTAVEGVAEAADRALPLADESVPS